MLLFIPVGILSLLTGKVFKRAGQKHQKFFVVAWICIPLLLIFGSYSFIFRGISYDVSDIYSIEEKTDLDLPDKIKMASHNYGGYRINYIKITDTDEATDFVKEISADERWTTKINANINEMLPLEIQAELINFDFFAVYNLSTDTYNELSTSEKCKYVFIAYDCEPQRIIILDDYVGQDDYQ